MNLWTIAMLASAEDDCVDGRVTVDGVEHADLTAALAAAVEGSWIEVCAGTYVGPFVATVPVHLVAPEGPEVTLLDGGLADSVLTLPGGSTLSGFTVTGGASATDGGGLKLTSAGETLLQDCTFQGNTAAGGGGAVFAPDGSTVRAWDSRFIGNTAAWGGAFLVGNRASTPPAIPNLGVVLDLEGSTISGNTAQGTLTPLQGGAGGGIVGYDATVLGGEVTGNLSLNVRSGAVTALGQGGGISLFWDSTVVGTVVSGNTAQGGGGGLHLSNGSTVVLDGVRIEDNDADRNGGGVAAHGLSRRMQVFAHGSVIRGNHTTRDGGGVTVSGGQQTGVTWTGGKIIDNTASSGAGMFIEGGSHAISEVEFIENIATFYGGGAGGRSLSPFFSFWTLSFTDCEFKGNVALNETGGGLDLGQPATIRDSEFKGNVARQGGAMSLFGWRHLSPTQMPYTLDNVEIKENAAAESGGGLLVTGNAAVSAQRVEVKDNVAPVAGGVNLEDGAMTATGGGDYKDNTPDDVWVAEIASGYTDLEDFACTNAGCVASDD